MLKLSKIYNKNNKIIMMKNRKIQKLTRINNKNIKIIMMKIKNILK